MPSTKHWKSSISSQIASCVISLRRVGCQKVILHLLFDQETALNTAERKKMSLESYSQEARRLLASFLSSLLDTPGHWYAPMLPDDHPSSFCKLTGLASGELCLVLEASDFVVKQGKNKNSYSFQSDAFKASFNPHSYSPLIKV